MAVYKCLVLFMLSGLFMGCVGTVQDTTLPLTEIAAKPKGSINFGGIVSAVPISQDKIEIFFYPAVGGSSKYYYTFYVGDKPLPYTFPSEVLTADYRGFLKVTINGLSPAKTYIIKGEAIDQESLDKDTNTVTVSVTTFSNLVADFIGITGASNAAGMDGIDSLNVRWTHAKVDYGNISGSAVTDPKRYEIVAVDSDRLTPGDMDKTQFGPAEGRHVKIVDYDASINEAVIRGLKSNTKYYVRVRCLHENSIDDYNSPHLRGEKNTNYLTISTLNASLSNVQNLDTLEVSKNPGLAQSTSLLLSWDAITGVFDHLRVYYTRSPNPLTVETGSSCVVKDENSVSCRKLLGTALSTIIANLTSYQTYFAQIVACQNADCTVYKAGPIKQGNTVPSFAGFSGLSAVDIASNVTEIGNIYLRIPLPDFTEGDFDGYIVGFKQNTGPDFVELSEISHPSLAIAPYNHRTDTTIVVTGVDYKVGGLYCFTVYPFVYNPDGTKSSQPNEIWKCNTPEIKAPDKDQFPGLNESSTLGYDLMLSWTAPSSGIYEEYELYLRKTAGTFSFSEAKAHLAANNTSTYDRVVLPWYMLTYQFSNLAVGTYKLGIITRYAFGSYGIYRSEDNEQTFVCVIDGAVDGDGAFVFTQCAPGI